MRTSIFLLLIIGTFNCWAQVIIDERTPERDKVFYELECGLNNLILKRVLTIGESASIRKGRELLVGIDEQDNIIYKFEDIDNYSSLFFEGAKFNLHDINSDGTKELIIEIEPWESSNTVWIYQLKTGCKPQFVTSLTVDEYDIRSNELVTKKNAVCTYWDECIDYESIFGRIDFERLTRVDFYSLKDGKLINSNSEHRNTINERITDYKTVLGQLAELKSKSEYAWEREQIAGMEDLLNQIINEY